MGKSKKKSASKVAVAAPASSPAQPLKKGKREAEVAIENELISAKKQKASEKKSEIKPEKKKDEKRVESEQKPEAKAPVKPDSDSSGVAEDAPTPVPAQNVAAPPPSSNGRSEEETAKKEETEEDLKKKTKSSPEKAPKANDTVATPKEQSTGGGGSKTIFVKNMPFQILLGDVVEFFRSVGGVVDVRFARSREDDSFKGYGHVEFATAEQAEKALLELNGKEMLNRPVKLEVAREEKKVEPKLSFKRKPKLEVFVTGFDAFSGENKIRASLMAHFASCGKIARVSIPSGPSKVPVGPRKRPTGIAFVQFMTENARNKALELGNETLVVGEPRPSADRDSGGFGSSRGRRRGLGGGGRGLNKGKPLTGANETTVGGD